MKESIPSNMMSSRIGSERTLSRARRTWTTSWRQRWNLDGWEQHRKCSLDSTSPHARQYGLSRGFCQWRVLPVGRRWWASLNKKCKYLGLEDRWEPSDSQSILSQKDDGCDWMTYSWNRRLKAKCRIYDGIWFVMDLEPMRSWHMDASNTGQTGRCCLFFRHPRRAKRASCWFFVLFYGKFCTLCQWFTWLFTLYIEVHRMSYLIPPFPKH